MRIAFAHPGDLATPTGGYGYDRRLIAGLSALHEVEVVHLPGDFPDPSEADIAAAAARLAALPAGTVAIVDGLAYGAMPAAALGAVAAPLVALCHHPLALETGLDPARAPAVAATERAALARAAAVLVTSPVTRDTLVADYGVPADAVTVALPGLDRAAFVDRTPETPPLIVTVGSVIPRKGYDVLAAALALVADLPWRAAIAGGLDASPETAAKLRADVAPLGERVAILGAADESAVRALYTRGSVFALATRYEGFGMVFAEAMAAGLPVVATRGGAVPSVVPDDAGILVPVDDAPGFAAALRRVLTEPDLAARLSTGARAAAGRLADWDATAATVADVAACALAARTTAAPA